jgi:hypothetical protein
MPGGGSKRGERRGGRQKGTPNKFTATVHEMILEALHAVGGVDYLAQQARENPVAFLSLLGKLLPTRVGGETGGSRLTVRVINYARVDADAPVRPLPLLTPPSPNSSGTSRAVTLQ